MFLKRMGLRYAGKKAIRALGIAESFRKEDRYSTLAGVVMRSDLIIDGFVFGRSPIVLAMRSVARVARRRTLV